LNLLFTCAHWHFLAKLRLHTDQTLKELDTVTTALGVKFRDFKKKTCTSFKTYELPKERKKRQRARAKQEKLARSAQTKKADTEADAAEGQDKSSRKEKTFNLETYKYHALADYAATIRAYGTTDSYSTEAVSYSNVLLCRFWIP
jgi:hypothetical protein